jgi:hypothetical protein
LALISTMPLAIKTGDERLHVEGHHSDPFVIDWDGDGDLDVLSGSSNGGVQWAENTAGKGNLRKLRPFQALIKPGRSIEYGQPLNEDDLTGPTTSTRVWAADMNGDGKLDLLVGDSVNLVTPANDLSAGEFKKKFAAWQKALTTASNEERKKLYKERSEFMMEDRTGFVWLYVQK